MKNNRKFEAILQLSLESNYECGILGKSATILAVNTKGEIITLTTHVLNETHNK